MANDQCKHCEAREDLIECISTKCCYHELWMVKALKKDIITLVLRLKGEDPDTFAPETVEVMERWLPKADEILKIT